MRIFQLSEITAYVQELLDADPLLSDLWVEGEVSNFSRAASGHCYFTLKEDDAQLRAVCFRSYAARIPTLPQNGDQILAHGRVAFYGGGGQIQLYVDMVRPAGVGLLHARFEELKARLAAEGLFDPARKRLLPSLPQRIGVATSAQGAAWRDILTVLERRFPLLEVVLAPCLVQGEQAPDSIVEALYSLYALANLDLIILARGGGSIEDLWAFNEESVARAVFASPIPLISGVGHETDTTIVDYVSDLRAPTPSAAAELATPDILGLSEAIASAQAQLDAALGARLDQARTEVDSLTLRLQRQAPLPRIAQGRQQVDVALQRAATRLGHQLALQQASVRGATGQLAALNPQATLERGYASVTRQRDGRPVTEPAQAQAGETLEIQLRGGPIVADVK